MFKFLSILKFFIIFIPFLLFTSSINSEERIGIAEKIVGNVYKKIIADKINAGDNLIYNQFVRTSDDSAATIKFDDGTLLHIGPDSELQLDDLVYSPKSKVLTGFLNLTNGVFQFANDHKTQMYVTLKTPVSTIGIRGTKFAAYAKKSYSELAVTDGNIDTISKFGSFNIAETEAVKVTPSSLIKSNSISKEMKDLFDRASSLLKFDAGLEVFKVVDAGRSAHSGRCSEKPSTWLNDGALKDRIKGINISNLLFVKTKYGIIVIKPNYGIARNIITEIRNLVETEYYKRVPFFNVRLGAVAEAGDFYGSKPRKPIKKAKKVILKTVRLKRGSVASGYPNDEKLGDGKSFFIALKDMRLVKSDYKVWGKIVYGIQFADKIEVGSPPIAPDFIQDMKTGSQIVKDCL
jgi:cyclophilin family peptidyl-prolyl cis-trans isomerase